MTKKKIVFVGDADASLANFAKSQYSYAKSASSFTKSRVVYTSLNEAGLENFIACLSQSDIIIYHNRPEPWTNNDHKKVTEYILHRMHFLLHKKVVNLPEQCETVDIHSTAFESCWVEQILPFDNTTVFGLKDFRKSIHSHLYVVGCSYALGAGLEDIKNQKYGQLVAQELQLPCVFLTQWGAGNDWAADQILRSDIKSGDTLIWGITSFYCMVWFFNNRQLYLAPLWKKRYGKNDNDILTRAEHIENMLYDPSRVYYSMKNIAQVISFCKKLSVNLYIIGDPVNKKLNSQSEGYKIYQQFLASIPNYIQLSDPVDIARDDFHPGSKTHQAWANLILDHIANKRSKE